jgi:hypothetical protein
MSTRKHIRLHGTQEEIDAARKALGAYKTDRWIYQGTIYQHMTEYLGIKIYEVLLSRTAGLPKTYDVLMAVATRFPRMLYQITDVRGVGYSAGINYNERDPQFPGPFGALCKKYNLPSYKTHFRDPEGVIRPIVRDRHTVALQTGF